MTIQETATSESIETARKVLTTASSALEAASYRLDENIEKAVSLILNHKGKVLITGVGKSGHIGQKIASTLCSTGTPAVFLHATEAVHGDLGVYHPGDPTILISNSGATSELVRLIPTLRQFDSPLIALVGRTDSPIAQRSDVVLDASISKEADPLGIVPTTSALVALAFGDALACALMQQRRFNANDFASFHPAGQLGRNLLYTVGDVMHKRDSVACVSLETSMRDAVIAMTECPQGAACVVDADGGLLGIVTDGDVRRTLQHHDEIKPLTVADIMTKDPISVDPSLSLGDALSVMEERSSQISVLPVVDASSKSFLGLIRIHDIHQPH